MPSLANASTLLKWLAALYGATSVTAGAVGSHLLNPSDPKALHRFETAVQYHQIHALALLALWVASLSGLRRWEPAALLWGMGTAIFCGCLYALAWGAPAHFGQIAPYGGMGMILGWLALLRCRS